MHDPLPVGLAGIHTTAAEPQEATWEAVLGAMAGLASQTPPSTSSPCLRHPPCLSSVRATSGMEQRRLQTRQQLVRRWPRWGAPQQAGMLQRQETRQHRDPGCHEGPSALTHVSDTRHHLLQVLNWFHVAMLGVGRLFGPYEMCQGPGRSVPCLCQSVRGSLTHMCG